MTYYEEIIGLNDYFQAAYDLENEIGSYWKQFIPNEKFYKTLSEVLNSLESNQPNERKSIWLQGTYGTGKSHATAVIKHLISDDTDKINDFVDNLEDQAKFKLKNFRKDKKAFTVVLKGASFISDNRTLALMIERAVKNAFEKNGINLTTETDFDRMIAKLKGNEINWSAIFKNTELAAYGSKEELIHKLQNKDIEILTKVENVLSEKGIHFSIEDITRWLIDLKKELKKNKIADYVVIFWDEFTNILEHPKSGLLLTEIQNIAELSINKDIYLFVVAHRKPNQTNIPKDDVEKVLGRFKVLDYSMEPITTYHIVNAAIKKIKIEQFKEIEEKYVDSINFLIEKIAGSEGAQTQKTLKNLFPIHPYTAYLATFIARNIGSTERSIFNFLYDNRYGFKKFIEENPGKNGQIFLTADHLWDFFYTEFERMESEKVHTVLEKFKLYEERLDKRGKEYLSVFKGILILNLLYKFTEVEKSSLVIPSEENIINLFAGSIDQKELIDILSFINNKQIISKTPDNLYLITSSGLPSIEVATEKNKLKSEYNTIDKILDSSQEKEIKDAISSYVNRETEITIMDAGLNKYLLRKKVEKSFKKSYAIHLCLFFGKSEQELQQLKITLEEIFNDKDLENVIFVISEVTLNDKIFNRFIEYKARAIVADKHNYSEERNINEKYARNIIDEWINRAKSGYIEWFLKDETGKELMNNFATKITKDLTTKIFMYGLENIDELKKNKNVWTHKRAKTSAEIFLFANDRNYIEEKTLKGLERSLREIIKDNNKEYIVDINLRIKEDVSNSHPLKRMYLEVRKALEKKKNSGIFNLGESLIFLTKPPYGLYPNMVNMAAVGFLMREYVDKLFEAGTGMPIQKETMRDKILTLFDYWERQTHGEKLEVRFGTEDEKKLIDLLQDLFKLDNVVSLNDARWKVRGWIKKQGFPIWVFKSAENVDEKIINAIDSIFELVQSTDIELTYNKIKEHLHKIKSVEYELAILIKPKNMKSLFEKWLKNIEKVKIANTYIEEVIDYIRRNMQEEVASWTEDKVREIVKDWYTEQLKKQIETIKDDDQKKKNDEDPSKAQRSSLSKEKIARIKQRINAFPVDRLREILIKVIEENPMIADSIVKYVEER